MDTNFYGRVFAHEDVEEQKSIFEVHLRCSKDPSYTILKMAEDIDNYTHRPEPSPMRHYFHWLKKA